MRKKLPELATLEAECQSYTFSNFSTQKRLEITLKVKGMSRRGR